MQQYNKTRGFRGIVSTYDEALRFWDMITEEAEERARILDIFIVAHSEGVFIFKKASTSFSFLGQ
jgi:hypothetical protein